MAARVSLRAYLGLFLGLTLALGLVGGAGFATFKAMSCDSRGYDDGNYLGYCSNTMYGDYEHGALYYGLEPEALAGIRAAQVIFLGHSRAGFGFSSPALRDYFDHRGVPYYLLAFVYGERSRFPLAVMRRWDAAPRLIVIDADPFFSDSLDDESRAILGGDPRIWMKSLLKRQFQKIHRPLCQAFPSVCRHPASAIYLARRDGQWLGLDIVPPGIHLPVDPAKREPVSTAELDAATRIGNETLDRLGLDRRCVVLTGIPNSQEDSEAMASALAKRLGTRLILPQLEGLTTLDNSHLDAASAERWSRAFLAGLDPVLRDCLNH